MDISTIVLIIAYLIAIVVVIAIYIKYACSPKANKEDNSITGISEIYNKSIKGKDLLNSLLIDGKYASYDAVFSDKDIYNALLKCKNLIYEPCCDSDTLYNNMSPLSARQAFCSESAIKLIMEDEYNHALHEFEDCIDDYGKGKNRYVTKNEMILYNCILVCFISRLKKNNNKQ